MGRLLVYAYRVSSLPLARGMLFGGRAGALALQLAQYCGGSNWPALAVDDRSLSVYETVGWIDRRHDSLANVRSLAGRSLVWRIRNCQVPDGSAVLE